MNLFLFDKTENTFIRIIKNILVYSFILIFVFTPLMVVFPPFKTIFSIFMSLNSFSLVVSLCILIIYGFIWFVTTLFNETKEERLHKKLKRQQELLSEKAENATFLFNTEYSHCDENSEYQNSSNYFLTDDGEIIAKNTTSTHDIHNIIRGYKYETFEQITFEEFNTRINRYNDEDIKKYSGINENNYKSYLNI